MGAVCDFVRCPLTFSMESGIIAIISSKAVKKRSRADVLPKRAGGWCESAEPLPEGRF